jgi:hypothetical protein
MASALSQRIKPRAQRGNAALEALMLLVFLIIPLWGLSFTMGYLGVRAQKTQESLTLATYHYVVEREAGANNPGANSQALTEEQVFPGETDALVVNIDNQEASLVTSEISAEDRAALLRYMGNVSGRSSIAVSVSRSDPMGQFSDGHIDQGIVVGGAAMTFCDVEDEPLNPFESSDIGAGTISAISTAMGVSSYVLAPFGGLPLGDTKCK